MNETAKKYGQFYLHAYVIKGTLERTETNLIHFKWEVT